jgi:hypothetical protein
VPAILSDIPINHLYGLHVVIAAWGMTYNGEFSRYMKSTILKVLSNEYCEHRIMVLRGYDTTIPKNIICTVGLPYAIMTNVSFR